MAVPRVKGTRLSTVGLVAIGLVLTLLLNLSLGAESIGLPQLWLALLHHGDPLYQTIVWELRLPRIIAGLVVGAALGMSGALLQG